MTLDVNEQDVNVDLNIQEGYDDQQFLPGATDAYGDESDDAILPGTPAPSAPSADYLPGAPTPADEGAGDAAAGDFGGFGFDFISMVS